MQYHHPWRPSCVRTIFDKSVKQFKRKDYPLYIESRSGVIPPNIPCSPIWCSPKCRLTDCRYCLKKDAAAARPHHMGDCEWPPDKPRKKKSRPSKNRKIRTTREKKYTLPSTEDSNGNYFDRFKESLQQYPNKHLSKESTLICCCYIPEISQAANNRIFAYGNSYDCRKFREDVHSPAREERLMVSDSRRSQVEQPFGREKQCMCCSKYKGNKRNSRRQFVRRSCMDHYEHETKPGQYLQHISPITNCNGTKAEEDSANIKERGLMNRDMLNEMILDSIRDLQKTKRKDETRTCNCEYSNHLKINEDDVTYMKWKLNEALGEIKKCNRNVEKSLAGNQEDSTNQDLYLSMVNDCQKRCSEIEKRIQKLCEELNSIERNSRHSPRQSGNFQEENGRGNLNNEEQRKYSTRDYFENKGDRPTRDIDESSKSTWLEHNQDRNVSEENKPMFFRSCNCKDSKMPSRANTRKSKRKEKEKMKTSQSQESGQLSPKPRKKPSNGPAPGTDDGSDSLKVGGACYHIRCFPSDQVLGNPKFVKCRGYKEVIEKMKNKRDFRRLTRKKYT